MARMEERNQREGFCPRCGAPAEWAFLDAARLRIEVKCPNCGRHETLREDFDCAATEHAGVAGLD
jgi:endogenous inhibitor of DNA gyrase (YacG/DUF329 family)